MVKTKACTISLAISWEQIAECTSDGKPCLATCLGDWTGVWSRGQLFFNGITKESPSYHGTMAWLNSLFNILVVDVR